MIKAIVSGAAGRMGKSIINVIANSKGIEICGGIEKRGDRTIGKDIGEVAGIGRCGIPICDDLKEIVDECDVIIDFTAPAVSMEHLKISNSRNKAIVIGTTGFSIEERKEINGMSDKVRCVISPNMSVGINVMFRLIRDATSILGEGYDIEIVEAHHRLKKDAPSGTAIRMAEILAHTLKRDLEKVGVYCRKGIIGERSKDEIGIQTVRAGDIVGEHTVIFGGIGERLEIIHRAQSRDNFARGAVRAAIWIVDQRSGIYDMEDVLGL
ncbi:MAG: 4-hydroxy-tetrahydrodipicolinate reductase [Nitrospinae bacterium]|nr:4-hydroxy-tetrahydrodipicolinate reductase [Nitrospinota bacterium]